MAISASILCVRGLYEIRANAGEAWSEWEHNVMVRPGSEANVKLRLSFKPPPVAAAVELKGTMRTWDVPVSGGLPHDPAVDPAGNVWFTLQESGHLARFTPDTQQWKLYKVPTAESGPHGLVADASGNIWFTENYAGKIGRVDAKSGAITEFTPPTAKDPHTPVFGPDGGLWFTSQNSNLIGRMDVATGKITEFSVPTQNAHPYGMVAAEDGGLWFCELTGQKLGRMDPKTDAIAEFTPPGSNVHPRRLVAAHGAIYFTDSGGGRLGRLTLADKKFKMWPSPSGDRLRALRHRARFHRKNLVRGKRRQQTGAFRSQRRNLYLVSDARAQFLGSQYRARRARPPVDAAVHAQ